MDRQKPQENLDDVILSIFEDDDQLVFPITSDRDARKFISLLQRKGVDNNYLSQEIDEAEAEVSSWQKSLKKSALGRKVMERINQPLSDYLLLESELEYENSFIYVEELDVEGFDCSEMICNGANSCVASSTIGGERVIGRPCSLLRGIKKRKCKRIPICDANGEQGGESRSQETQAAYVNNDPSDQGAPLDEGDFSLVNSEREFDAASGTRMDEQCLQNQQANDGVAMSEEDHTDCNASALSQPDWDDICDRFLLADESSLYEDIQTVQSAIDQCRDHESACSLTDSDYPTEDNEATTSELSYTPHNVDYNTSESESTTNERKESLDRAMQHSSEWAKSDCAFDGFELSLDVDRRSIGESETVEGGKQKDNLQGPDTLTGQSIFETQENRIGYQQKVDEVPEIPPNDYTTLHNQDLLQDDGLLVVPTTPGDEELNKCEVNEDTKSLVQIEVDRNLSISTASEDSNTTVEREILPIATASSTFESKNQSTLNALGAEMKNDRDSFKCASVVRKSLQGYIGTEHEHLTSGITCTSVKDSSGFSTDYSPAANHEVESLFSVSSIVPDTQDNLSLFSDTKTAESVPTVSEEITLLLQESMHSTDSSPIGESVLSESSLSIKDAKDFETQTNAESLPLHRSEPYSESSLFQDSELHVFLEFQETKPFTETSLLEELEHLTKFSLFGKSRHFDEAEIEKEEIPSDRKSQPQLPSSTNLDPESDSKTCISTSLSSEATSQEQPGYIYVFTDGCSSSKVQRFKVGSVSCPYEELQRAKMFNVDIKLVSATAHSSPDRVFQQIKSRLEQWKMEGREDWFLCSSTVILQTITEVINAHL